MLGGGSKKKGLRLIPRWQQVLLSGRTAEEFRSLKPDSCEWFCGHEVGMDVARDVGGGYVKTWREGEGTNDERVIKSTLKSYQ